jgi:Kef-type K+ transport system membrane component KefB
MIVLVALGGAPSSCRVSGLTTPRSLARRIRPFEKQQSMRCSKIVPLHMVPAMEMFPDVIHAASHALHSTSAFLAFTKTEFENILPFAEMGRQLSDSLDIGNNLSRIVNGIPETTTGVVLESLGYDVLVFLAASVFVTPVCKALNITPILGYLIIGAILGPHGMDVFANSKADVELGDFGILFLLFSEGLEVTTPRLKKLTNFLPLGMAQISLVTGVITAAILTGVPQIMGQYLPLDPSLINIQRPSEALVLAFAGALSTSAFIFPVLKERGWEEEESGEAATSILLLQDLMVAPLLVLLPFLVGENETNYAAIAFLTAKATIGFGAIMYVASFLLRRLFAFVAQAQSTETFVALCLLVAAGMGAIAKFFGLTDTAGAFAAGAVSNFLPRNAKLRQALVLANELFCCALRSYWRIQTTGLRFKRMFFRLKAFCWESSSWTQVQISTLSLCSRNGQQL